MFTIKDISFNVLKYVFLIISSGAWLGAWSDFLSFLSLADQMPDLCSRLL